MSGQPGSPLTTQRREAKSVSATRVIEADSATIFDLLADPSKHSLIDGSGTVQGALESVPERLYPGAKFSMSMKLGVPYRMSNEVVEFEEGSVIGWRHFGGHVWRYELEPLSPTTTRVTETFDWEPARIGIYYPLTGFPNRNLTAMHATLARLAEVVEGD